jgi:hypothetical protein
MSVDQFLQLIVEDPELRQRLVDAGSNEERAAIGAEIGIEVPSRDEVTARIAELQAMADVEGGAFMEWFAGGLVTLAATYTAITFGALG